MSWKGDGIEGTRKAGNSGLGRWAQSGKYLPHRPEFGYLISIYNCTSTSANLRARGGGRCTDMDKSPEFTNQPA